jgi:hypothetical protein
VGDVDDQVAAIKRAMWVRVASRQTALLLTFHDLVVAATPVDTGNARAHWAMSVGIAADAPVPPLEFTRKGRPKIDDSAQVAGTSAIAGYRPTRANALKVLFDTNAVAYIQALNDGWSKQAPMMFVEAAAAQAVLEVNTMSDDEIIAIFPSIGVSGELDIGADVGDGYFGGASDELAGGGSTIIAEDAYSFAGSGGDDFGGST